MIQFDSKLHEYSKDGLKVPGVTKVLQAAGLIDFSKVPQDILTRALKFGTAVHKATELHDKGRLDPVSVDPAIEPYLNAWFKFLDDTGFIIDHACIEEKVYSEKYRYAGKYDRVGILYDKRAVIDISTSVDFSDAKALQTAAYKEAYDEGKSIKEKIKQREIVLLKGDGTYALAPEEFFQKSDFSVFLAALTLYNWKGSHGKNNNSSPY